MILLISSVKAPDDWKKRLSRIWYKRLIHCTGPRKHILLRREEPRSEEY